MSVLHLFGWVYDSALSLSIASANIGNIFSLHKIIYKNRQRYLFCPFQPLSLSPHNHVFLAVNARRILRKFFVGFTIFLPPSQSVRQTRLSRLGTQ